MWAHQQHSAPCRADAVWLVVQRARSEPAAVCCREALCRQVERDSQPMILLVDTKGRVEHSSFEPVRFAAWLALFIRAPSKHAVGEDPRMLAAEIARDSLSSLVQTAEHHVPFWVGKEES